MGRVLVDWSCHVVYGHVMSRKDATFQVRCTDEELEAWRKLAASKGYPLAAYVRELLTAMLGAVNGGS